MFFKKSLGQYDEKPTISVSDADKMQNAKIGEVKSDFGVLPDDQLFSGISMVSG